MQLLTVTDIQNKDFRKATIRGYREDEVDEFLDKIAADYDKIIRENEKLKEQASLNVKEIAQFRKLEKNLQDTLVVAQSTAEEVMSAAKKNAEEMRNNTQRECQNIREQAQIDARRQIEDANVKLRAIVSEYDRLVRDKNAFLLKIRTALETELAVTTQLLNSIPHPDNDSQVNSQMQPVSMPPMQPVQPVQPIQSQPVSTPPVMSEPSSTPTDNTVVVQKVGKRDQLKGNRN